MTKKIINQVQEFLTYCGEDRVYQIVNVEVLLKRHPPEAVIGFLILLREDYKKELRELLATNKTDARICERNPNDLKVFVIVAPDDRLKGSAEDTIGDSRWCGINYQVLHDVILVPLSKHPGISSHTAPLIAQYIDALRVPINGRKLAVTEEERELALDLYEKHKDAFEALNAALAESKDLNLVTAHSQKTVLSVKINSDEIKGNTVTELYQNALKYIKEKGINIESQLPYATSEKRFLIAKSPFHPEDKKFRVPVEADGYFMEAHKNRIQAVKDLARVLKKIGLKAEIP